MSAAELDAFLASHPSVETVQVVLTDINGVGRGKSIAREELVALYRDGRRVAGSILGLDTRGEDVEETGLVWSVGDADQVCRPIPGTLRPLPWLQRPTAQVLLAMYGEDGAPAIADPRHALARVVERARAAGYTPVVAVELEFYLLDGDGDPPQPARGLATGEQPQRLDAYGLEKLDEMAPLFDDLYAAARAQGLPLRTLMSEYAPGQFEITLEHRADALQAADDAVMYKRLVRGVARRHGRVATFMAKPFAASAGSGCHLHLSFNDAKGRNVFAADDPAGTPLLRHAIAGLQRTMADGMAIFAPNANSYRRFQRQSYAPVAPTWGVNNRSVGLRVPAGPPASRHLEHRACGADANPYLAIAAVIAGALAGIEGGWDPGPPVTGNGYVTADPEALPRYWPIALERAAASQFLREAFGDDFVNLFMAIKRAECERFHAEPTSLDHAWYQRLA